MLKKCHPTHFFASSSFSGMPSNLDGVKYSPIIICRLLKIGGMFPQMPKKVARVKASQKKEPHVYV